MPERRTNAARELEMLVLSDRPLIRDLMVQFLRQHGFPQAEARGSSDQPFDGVPEQRRGLLLFDVDGTKSSPQHILRELRELRPNLTLVAVGTPMQLAAQAADADGWIELSDPGRRLTEIATAVARPHRGALKFAAPASVSRLSATWTTLTRRQRQVLALLGCGVANHKLARALGVSERAVKAHISALFEKFDVDSRAELALIACRAGLASPGVESARCA